MKVLIKKIERGRWKLVINQGNQYFELAHRATKKDCEWMRKMFYKALKAHNEELTTIYD